MTVGKIDDIQVLRAAAVIMVAVNHSFYGKMLPDLFKNQGGDAVGLFFVISGFVIARSALKRFDEGQQGWRFTADFMWRRVFRIVPAALAWLVIYLFFAGLAGVTLFDEVIPILELRYNYAMTSTRMVVGHYWSLMVEEHFYLAFALLFAPLVRQRLLLSVCVLGIIAVFYGRPYVDDPGGHLTQTRVDSFFAGIMIAWMMHGAKLRQIGEILRWALGITALALILIIAILFGQPVPEGFTLLLLASFGVVAIGAINQDIILPVPYLRGAMVWIGERSYSIYLSNSLVAYADYWLRGHVEPFRDSPTALRLALSVGLILLLGDLSYRIFERGGERVGVVLRQLIARWFSSREAVAT